MATSGTVTYRTNRDEIIKGALRLVGGYDPENSSTPSATQITIGAEALNLLVKHLETQGLHIWERRYAVVFPQPEQGVYVFGSPGPAGDHATFTTPLGYGGFVSTTLSSAAAAGAGSIVVTSASSDSTAGISAVSITNAYNIGIELDSGAVQWTTVNGAPVGTTVTLTAVLTGAAAAGNKVFCYQTKLVRPLQITDGFVRQISGGSDTPCSMIPRENYNRYGNKLAVGGGPTQLYYDPQTNAGHLYIYPTFTTADQLLYLEVQKPIEDFSASTDDHDLPQEWGLALKYNLALYLAPEYEVSEVKFKQITTLATVLLAQVSGWDQEQNSVFIMPDMRDA